MKIKVLVKTEGCFPEVFEKGDWIDLKVAQEVNLRGPHAYTLHRYRKGQDTAEKVRDVEFDSAIVPMGVCIEVQKGYECIMVPRSGTFKKYGIVQTNGIGVIDQTYCSDKDEWKMPIMAVRKTCIPKGTRIAQFRVQLSQKATWWQKLKWLFSRTIKLEQVESLNNEERKGLGEGTADINLKESEK